MPETAGDAITAPDDPSPDNGGRTSTYIGVFKIKRKSGAERWRVKFRLSGKSYHVGEFEKEIDAARSYDNVIYYVAKQYKQRPPLLNFPNTYSQDNPDMPQKWTATQRILKRLKADLAPV